MRVGIVCEGKTDFVVLRAVVEAMLVDMRPTCALLQPDHDRVRRPGEPRSAGGWQAVRAFLKAGGAQRALDLERIDLIIVQIDASVRHDDEVAPLLEADDTEALCDHVKEWMGDSLPQSVIIALPCEEIEAWLLAVNTRLKDVESVKKPADVLVARGLLAREGGQPAKRSHVYVELMRPWFGRLGDRKLLRTVPELDRLCSKLRAHHRRRGR